MNLVCPESTDRDSKTNIFTLLYYIKNDDTTSCIGRGVQILVELQHWSKLFTIFLNYDVYVKCQLITFTYHSAILKK